MLEVASQALAAEAEELLLVRLPGTHHRPHDAAAPRRLAEQAGPVLVGLGPSPEQVHVSVHEPRRHTAAGGVDDRRLWGKPQAISPARRGADPHDLAPS